MTEERRLVSREDVRGAVWRVNADPVWGETLGEIADAIFAALPQPATEPKPWHDGMTLVVHPDGTRCWHRPPVWIEDPQPATEPALDGLSQLITTILRKYGGTMKGRGDHDIFDALVRYRDAAAQPSAEGHALNPDHLDNPLRDAAAQPSAEVERLRVLLDNLATHHEWERIEGNQHSRSDRCEFVEQARAALAGSDRP